MKKKHRVVMRNSYYQISQLCITYLSLYIKNLIKPKYYEAHNIFSGVFCIISHRL